jgi:hypothetical protein
MRRFITGAGGFLVLAALLVWFRPGEAQRVLPDAAVAERRQEPELAERRDLARADELEGAAVSMAEAYPLAAELNMPRGTIAQDLEIVNEILVAWRTNFPRQGNPVGLNAEITAALAGDNALELVLIPREHRAVNSDGELCDRWGTPFRFHQISGEHMEIRSAGPDRTFGTDDDVAWMPGVALDGK